MNTTDTIPSAAVRLTLPSRILVWATPPVLAVVVLLHRTDPTDAMDLAGDTTTWIWIHVALLGALVLLANAVRYLLLVGLPGRAAALARGLLPIALVTYAAFDSLVGLGTGVLVERADHLGPDAAVLVEHWWSVTMPISAISAVAQVTWVFGLGIWLAGAKPPKWHSSRSSPAQSRCRSSPNGSPRTRQRGTTTSVTHLATSPTPS